MLKLDELYHQKTGPTQTELYKFRSRLEAGDFGFRKKRNLYYPCSENKGTDQLHSYMYCEADLPLVFPYAKCWFSHDEAHLLLL